ncbi:glycoside hydrolase family 9 protein [Vibrio hannami]|uniref:glycoside hydrolase family 9 protein n=1 Tax=Vibrio hannami TaxID=2717094 RepID=UPI00240FF408|nr:glycoside hydrolase family 9 protein [Vibrio hannami]MDG3087172.1 glycoside hydrolase family 9 protein [Vibrio hannami]
MQLLTNHIGYELTGEKQAVLMTDSELKLPLSVKLFDSETDTFIKEFPLYSHGSVANWYCGLFYSINFTSFSQSGSYYLQLEETRSHVFKIEEGLLFNQTFSDLLHYFKSQRCGGIFEQKDKSVQLLGSNKTVDVSGGWYDASGDVSKYLSHLSYANYLNPQQTPMVVWNMLKGLELLESKEDVPSFLKVRLIEEALHGADFLVRMQSPDGYFYMTVFDKWSKDTEQREICAYSTQEGIKSQDFQSGFRQGAGITIAALAAAARLEHHGEFNQPQYLECAIVGYRHLLERNLNYLPDGTENIIDEYCALLAAIELYRTTGENLYLNESRLWAHRLCSRQKSDTNFANYWSADNSGNRPYFHASEAGLPVIALCEYLSVEPDSERKKSIKSTVGFAMIFELMITQKVTNPFGYPRQYVKSVSGEYQGEKRDAFFVAKDNESGYWWQGENARLGSLACAAYLSREHIEINSIAKQMEKYAQDSLNWIAGLNPFDTCMMDGHGHNNPDYLPELGFSNAKGGICNGVTAGFEDEQDIAFIPEKQKNDMLQNWRWGEQWIPHAAWFLLAVISQYTATSPDKAAGEKE